MKHRVINDGRFCITLTLGTGADEAGARISWIDGSCEVDAEGLVRGRWILTYGEAPPPVVICRATALAVAAVVRERGLSSTEGNDWP